MKRSLLFSSIIVCVLVLSACTTQTQTETLPNGNLGTMVQPGEDTSVSDTMPAGTEDLVYEGTQNYTNPGGDDDVGFKLVVDASGTVTDADATVMADNSTSVTRQTAFKNAIKSAVVGKPLTGLTVDRVGGSSLTSKAFNEWVSTLQ